MAELILELARIVGGFTPMAVIGLLVVVIGLQVWFFYNNSAKHSELTSNHLHDLPEIRASLVRIEASLNNLAGSMSYLIGRLNGRSSVNPQDQ